MHDECCKEFSDDAFCQEQPGVQMLLLKKQCQKVVARSFDLGYKNNQVSLKRNLFFAY
jgi:hypothetical protein